MQAICSYKILGKMDRQVASGQAELFGRSGEIWTHDPLLPKQVRYQAALHSEQFLLKYGYGIYQDIKKSKNM